LHPTATGLSQGLLELKSPKSFRSHLESPLRVLLVVAKIVTITLRRPRPFSFQKFSVPVSLTRCRFTLVGTNAGARARVSLVHPLKKCKHSCPPISVRRIRRFALRPTGHFPRPKVFRPIRAPSIRTSASLPMGIHRDAFCGDNTRPSPDSVYLRGRSCLISGITQFLVHFQGFRCAYVVFLPLAVA